MGDLNISLTAVIIKCIQTRKSISIQKVAGGPLADDDILKNASSI